MIWTFIPAKLCLIYDGGLIFLQLFDFLNERWIDSSRTLFEFRAVNQMFEVLTRTDIFLLNCYSCRNCLLVDLNRYSWTNEPLSERMHFDQWLDQLFPRTCLINRWTELLNWNFELLFLLTLFDCQLEPLFLNDQWIEPLFLSDRLNFDRWFELLFPRNYWTVIPERTFERWFEPIFPRHCWLERSFELWSSNPVTFVGLRNGRFPAYVLRDSVCFELSVHMYTYLRSWIWTIYFRHLAFVTWRSSGIWTMRFRRFAFVRVSELTSAVSDLLSRWNLSYLLPRLCLRTCFPT